MAEALVAGLLPHAPITTDEAHSAPTTTIRFIEPVYLLGLAYGGQSWPTLDPTELVTSSLFDARDGLLVPTEYSRGPWSLDSLHGGPVAALLARAVESCEPDASLQVTRLTVELVRPVRLEPLRLEAQLLRPGRKVQLVEASATQDGAEVAKARALRVRVADVALPDVLPEEDDVVLSQPDQASSFASTEAPRAFHTEGAELRFSHGEFPEPGPARVWIRLLHPVVAGERPSALQRAAAAADFGNGVSSPLPFGSWSFINPDLTVYLNRMPEGEWVGLDSHTYPQPNGIGLSESRLFDTRGPLGRAAQSLLLDPLRPAGGQG